MYLILVGGGHASGKRKVTMDLVAKLEQEAESVCQLNISVIDLKEYERTKYKPDIDFEKLSKDLDDLEKKECAIAIVYGNYALYNDDLCTRASVKVFLDTDADVRLSQWILRDSVNGKHVPLANILEEYLDHCREEFETYIEATKLKADVLLPQGSDPLNIELMATGILEEIMKKDQNLTAFRNRNAGTPMINLRAEVASNLETQFYSTA